MLAAIDWSLPWFESWRELGEPIAREWRVRPLHQSLGPAGPFQFVAQHELPDSEPYESFVLRTRTIPTRDNAHDFFNGLAWLRFPELKQRLNELQVAEIARHGIGARRGPVRDA